MLKRSILPLVALLLALIGILLDAPPANAHAIIVRSEPPDGASLAAAPGQVRLWFSEPVALKLTTLDLVDGDGKRIPVQARGDAASLAVAVRSGEAAGAVLVVVDLPKLAPNVYRLSWRTLSSNDLHNTVGTIVFGVGRPAGAVSAAAVEAVPSPLEVALRWLNLAAIAALIGALAIALLAASDRRPTTDDRRPTTDDRRPTTDASPLSVVRRSLQRTTDDEPPTDQATYNIHRRLLRLALWSGLLALVAGAGLLIAQALAAGGVAGQTAVAALWQIVGGTSYGAAWALREGALLALVIMLAAKQNRASSFSILRSPFSILFVPLVLVLAVAQALQSHATAFGDFSLLRVLADALHVLAASVWAGGVLALALAVVPLLPGGAAEAAPGWAILRRFGALASSALAALLVSGLFMSGQQVASLDALLTTLYGHVLLIKLALALGVALLGLGNATALHPGVAGALRRLLRRRAGRSPFVMLPASQADPLGRPTHVWIVSPAAARWAGLAHLVSPAALSAPVRLTRRVALEALGALALLLLAATLSAAQPARGPAFDPPGGVAATPAVTTHADDLIVTLSVKPNQPGRNFISLGVFNTRRPAPASIGAVVARLQAPGDTRTDTLLVAEPLGGGRYQVAGSYLAASGDWQIVVTINRPGLPDTTAAFEWTVPPMVPAPQPVLVSNRPLAPELTLASAVLALLMGTAAAYLWWRRGALSVEPARPSVARRLHVLRNRRAPVRIAIHEATPTGATSSAGEEGVAQ